MAALPLVVFDVNETLSDLAPLSQSFADLGLPPLLAPSWFAQVLRDGFALAAAGGSAPFTTIAAEVLQNVFVQHPPNRDDDAATQLILNGFTSLRVHPDVPDGIRALAAAGCRLTTLTNGSTSLTETLLTTAGLRDHFERLLSVEATGRWKPALEPYAYAAHQCQVEPAELLLVAVHPWDIDGAARAGLQTAWVDRSGTALYPSYFLKPDLTVSGISDLARQLAVQPARVPPVHPAQR